MAKKKEVLIILAKDSESVIEVKESNYPVKIVRRERK